MHQGFDVMKNLEKFCKILETKQTLSLCFVYVWPVGELARVHVGCIGPRPPPIHDLFLFYPLEQVKRRKPIFIYPRSWPRAL